MRIRDLEEGSSAFHDRKGSLQKRSSRDRVKEEAVRLGVEYGLCSRWTSFVAVEKREEPVEGKLQLRRIPVALTRGWGGLDEETLMADPMLHLQSPIAACSSPDTMSAARPARWASSIPRLSRWKDRLFESESARERDVSFARGTREAEPGQPESFSMLEKTSPTLSTERPLDRLVALQRADGSWDLTEAFADVLGKPLGELEGKLVGAEGEPALCRQAWATALALIWLRVEANQFVDEWALLEEKARKWLRDCSARPADGQEWLDAAAESFP
jgi:hypothetical protein